MKREEKRRLLWNQTRSLMRALHSFSVQEGFADGDVPSEQKLAELVPHLGVLAGRLQRLYGDLAAELNLEFPANPVFAKWLFDLGVPVAGIAERVGVSRPTAYKLLRKAGVEV